MARGGVRPGAGGKSKWIHGKTTVIRVPEDLAEKILQIARVLDEEGSFVTESKVIDLTGIAVHSHPRGPVIYLADLLRAGYAIVPERLIRSLKPKVEDELKMIGSLESLLEESYERGV
jgi:hypothetical protein